MRWHDLDARFPELAWPEIPATNRWPALRRGCDAIATHLARRALGLATAAPDRDAAIAVLRRARSESYMVFGKGGAGTDRDETLWTGVVALAAAAYGDWELVAGDAPLPARVTGDPRFRADLHGLARHLAALARARQSTVHAGAAMAELRTKLANDTARPDPRVVLIAALVYFEQIAFEADVPEACRAWLDGAALVHDPRDAAPAIADGQDVRATIFERFVEPLSDRVGLARATALLGGEWRSPECDAAAVQLHIARHALPDGWVRSCHPFVAEVLGAEVEPAARRAALADLRGRAKLFRAVSNIKLANPSNLVHALLAHDDVAVQMITGRGSLGAFVPGRLWKDDWRAFGRYLLVARRANAAVADVEPAWLDLLARWSPRLVSWRELALLQRVITCEIGGDAPATAGAALRRAVTGE